MKKVWPLKRDPPAQVHMAKWLPSFVARDATANLPLIGVCRHVTVSMRPSLGAMHVSPN